MDAVEFLKARRRMCETNDCTKGGCPLFEHNCDNGTDEENAQTVAIVEQWSKEHPVKTRQSEVLKIFPNVQKSSNGVIDICPKQFDPEKYIAKAFEDRCIYSFTTTEHPCNKCCRDFWLKEIE